VRVLLVALLAGLAATVTANAARAACNVAAAKAAIRATHPKMVLLGGSPVAVDPASVDRVLCYDFTRDGRIDLAVTIASGGTAGDVGILVFRATPRGWAVALKRPGYKIGLFQLGGDVVSSQPIYKANDPNCCPTGGFAHDRYHWGGGRFVLLRSYHTKTYKP
jgi:hypothetical protein